MSRLGTGEVAAAERLYRLGESTEWSKLERLMAWQRGFALVVVLAPDRFGLAACRAALEGMLTAQGKKLAEPLFDDLPSLREFANRMLDLRAAPEVGAVWVDVLEASADPGRQGGSGDGYEIALRAALAGLNQQRNVLQKRLGVPLIFAGNQTLQSVLRTAAPDLWSIRAVVVDVRPHVNGGVREVLPAVSGPAEQTNLAMALDAVARLRGRPGLEEALGSALPRAVIGYWDMGEWRQMLELDDEAIGVYRALMQQGRPGQESQHANDLAAAVMNKGVALQGLGRLEEAIGAYEEAIGIRRGLVRQGRTELRHGLATALYNRATALGAAVEGTDRSIHARSGGGVLGVAEGALGTEKSVPGARKAEALNDAREARDLWKALVAEGRRELRGDLEDAEGLVKGLG